MNYNQSRPRFELESQCPFPTKITITPQAPPFPLSILWRLFQVHQLQWVTSHLQGLLVFFPFSKVEIFISLFVFFEFYSMVCKVQYSAGSLSLLTITRSGRLAEIMWSACISKSQTSLCVSFTKTYSKMCTYYLFVLSNLNLLHSSQWIPFPTQSCIVL